MASAACNAITGAYCDVSLSVHASSTVWGTSADSNASFTMAKTNRTEEGSLAVDHRLLCLPWLRVRCRTRGCSRYTSNQANNTGDSAERRCDDGSYDSGTANSETNAATKVDNNALLYWQRA